jgi:hypothetical protein
MKLGVCGEEARGSHGRMGGTGGTQRGTAPKGSVARQYGGLVKTVVRERI